MDTFTDVANLVRSVVYSDVSNQHAILDNHSYLAVFNLLHAAKPCKTLVGSHLAAIEDGFESGIVE
jgi:hypothetical protein